MGSRDPDVIAQALAHAKAAVVSARARGRFVLGADQVASCEGRLFGKPASMAAAADLLRFLSARRHRLHSAVALLRDGDCILETVAHADIEMRALSESFIARYLDVVGDRALASAGAYQVEGEEQRRQKLASSITDLKESLRLADLRYREGISTFLDVLDAQRVLYLEELNLAQSQAQTTLYLIALYKALGGAGQLEVKPVDEPLRPWG